MSMALHGRWVAAVGLCVLAYTAGRAEADEPAPAGPVQRTLAEWGVELERFRADVQIKLDALEAQGASNAKRLEELYSQARLALDAVEQLRREPLVGLESEVVPLREAIKALQASGAATEQTVISRLAVLEATVKGSGSGAGAQTADAATAGSAEGLRGLALRSASASLESPRLTPEERERLLPLYLTMLESIGQPATDGTPDPSAEASDAARRALAEEVVHELALRRTALAWQHVADLVIFGVAHLMLGIALWASIREFRTAARQRRAQPGTELSLGAAGLAVKTARTGVILLTAAGALYYLYVRFVYPIHEIG